MQPTEKIVRFVTEFTGGSMPKEGLDRVKSAILDYVGVTLAGFSEKCSQIVRRTAETLGGAPQATIWGYGRKTSVLLAALANGTAAHALDYDDVNSVIRSHPSIQLLPGLFALGEYAHKSGQEVIEAYLAGFEVGGKLGRALNPNLVYQGWFPVGTLGTLMQTLACTKLLDLDADQAKMALGIATNLASGLRCNNGTMAKPLMAGQVGSNGILATLLAREGLTANPQALEDRFGFFENFSRGEKGALEDAVDSLGSSWEIIQSGITHKLYPCCAGSHMAIDCALNLARNHPLQPAEINEIQVSISVNAKYLLIHPRPRTEMEAKFSLEYAVARAILDHQIGPRQFTPEKIHDPALKSLIEKINPTYVELSPVQSSGEWTRLPVEIKIQMQNGKFFSGSVDAPKGSPRNPLASEDLEEKFRQCCQGKLSESRIRESQDRLRALEKETDVADLVSSWREFTS